MTTVSKVSTCVDCSTPIIGERPRCPACHDRHAALLVAAPVDEDSATLPRERVAPPRSLGRSAIVWFIFAQIAFVIVVGLFLMARSCL